MKTSKRVKGQRGSADVELTPAELAARWGMAVRSLANWRSSGRGPRFAKIKGKRDSIRYTLPAVLEFERKRDIKA